MLFLSRSRLHSVSRFTDKLTYVCSTDRTKSELMPVLFKYILDSCPSLTCKDQKYKPKWKIRLVWLMNTWSWSHALWKWFKLCCDKKGNIWCYGFMEFRSNMHSLFWPNSLMKEVSRVHYFIYVLQSDCD